jgi:hypothetical protein
MFNFHITLAMAVSVLRKVVTAAGEGFAYSGLCVYVEGETDGTLTSRCILGKAFDQWGILRTLVAERSSVNHNIASGNSVSYGQSLCNLGGFSQELREYIAAEFGVTMDNEAFTFLRHAQTSQDSNVPWTQALDAAANAVLSLRGESVGSPLDRLNV